jgi:hypothetical protein
VTDKEITKAFDALGHLNAVSDPVGCGLPRDILFRHRQEKGDCLFYKYAQLIRNARDAVKPLGSPKACALLDEMVNLAQRMIRIEADLLPGIEDDELSSPAAVLFFASGTLCNYLTNRVFSYTRDTTPMPAAIAAGSSPGNTTPEYKKWVEEHWFHGTITRPWHDPLRVRHLFALSQSVLVARFGEGVGVSSEDAIDIIVDKLTQYISTLCTSSPRKAS